MARLGKTELCSKYVRVFRGFLSPSGRVGKGTWPDRSLPCLSLSTISLPAGMLLVLLCSIVYSVILG